MKNVDHNALFNWNRTAVLLLFVSLSGLVTYYSLNRFFDHDEFFAVHTAWKIFNGERMYLDFLQLHHPLLHLSLIPVLSVFGEEASTLIVARILILVVLFLIFLVTYKISISVYGRNIALTSVLLLAGGVHFIKKGIEIRPDVPQTLFGLLAVLYLIKYIRSASWKHLALSSLMLGVSFLFLQKTVFLIALVEAVLLHRIFNRKMTFGHLFAHWGVLVATVIPFYAYIVLSGSFTPYAMFSWAIHARLIEHFLPFNLLLESFQMNWVLWAFFVLGLLFFSHTYEKRLLSLFALALFGSIFLVRAPNPQYLLVAMPFMAMTAADAVHSVFHEKKKLIAVLLLSFVLPLVSLVYGSAKTNDKQLRKINLVTRSSGPEDYVFDGNILFNVFRKDLDYFWYSGNPGTGVLATYRAMTGYEYDIYKLIEEKKPKVISSSYIENMNDPRIADHYISSGVFSDILIRKDARFY